MEFKIVNSDKETISPGLKLFLDGVDCVRMGQIGAVLRLSVAERNRSSVSIAAAFSTISTAVRQQRIAFFKGWNGMLSAYVIWAYFDPETCERIERFGSSAMIHISEWDSGTNLCLVDMSAGAQPKHFLIRHILRKFPYLNAAVGDFMQFHRLGSIRIYSGKDRTWHLARLKDESREAAERWCLDRHFDSRYAGKNELNPDQMLGAVIEIAGKHRSLQSRQSRTFVLWIIKIIGEGRCDLFFSAEGVLVAFAEYNSVQFDPSGDNSSCMTRMPGHSGGDEVCVIKLYAIGNNFFSVALRIRTRFRKQGQAVVFVRDGVFT